MTIINVSPPSVPHPKFSIKCCQFSSFYSSLYYLSSALWHLLLWLHVWDLRPDIFTAESILIYSGGGRVAGWRADA